MHGLLISDFTIENLATYLRRDNYGLPIHAVRAATGQVRRVLADDQAEEWNPRPDFTVVWTRPESVLSQYAKLLEGYPLSLGNGILEEVDEYASALVTVSERTGVIFVPLWTLSPNHFGAGVWDLAAGNGPARALVEANHRLLTRLDGQRNVYPLLASRWIELAGPTAYSARLWYSGKIPFTSDVFRLAARDIHSGLRGLRGLAKKIVICDLDDTLWGGIVGDDGWQHLVLGGHDQAGEAFVDFQRGLKALTRRGVVLAIASKNDQRVALEAIQSHPEMVLKLDDFAAWRINWDDKAKNVVDLMNELNLALDSAVFIDDSAVERARVRDALPEVFVPDWPRDKRLYAQALHSLNCFDRPRITDEDRVRGSMYVAERQRGGVSKSTVSLDDWIASLEVAIRVEPLDATGLVRATQLLNKTNQMNASTRRLQESEFLAWTSQPSHEVLTIRVRDKFGDSGLTGLLSLAADGEAASVVDFVVSCRVLGRGVEQTMLHTAVDWARRRRLRLVRLAFVATTKNKPCLEFLRQSGFDEGQDNCFTWRVEQDYSMPPAIKLELALSGGSGGSSGVTVS